MSFQEWIQINDAYTMCLFLMGLVLGFSIPRIVESFQFLIVIIIEKLTRKKRIQGVCIQEYQERDKQD